MQILSFMFFSAVLVFSVGMIGTMITSYADKIVAALGGDVVLAQSPVVVLLPVRPKHHAPPMDWSQRGPLPLAA
ncbi:MAG: hypothetical protein ABL918_06895 [Chakrabartia sp.]